MVLLKGDEMGRFKLGSTVINLFAKNKVMLSESLEAEAKTRLGQPLASIFSDTPSVSPVTE